MSTFQNLDELKGLIEAARAGQVEAGNKIAHSLDAIGFRGNCGSGLRFPHPSEQEKSVWIDLQDCYFGQENSFAGYLHIDVVWYEPHQCDDDCSHNCNEEWDKYSRPATAEEIVEVLRIALQENLQYQIQELDRLRSIQAALPKKDEVDATRRRLEDYLRKNPRDIIPVAKLLQVL